MIRAIELLALGALAFVVIKFTVFVYARLTSPLKLLRGPPSQHWFYGNFKQVFTTNGSPSQLAWAEEYGTTWGIRDLFNSRRMMTTDPRAINHILTHSYEYQKPFLVSRILAQVLGEGVLLVEGDKHKKQNPAFGPIHIRAMTEIFVEKALQLRTLWNSQLAKDTSSSGTRLEVYAGLSKMTLDVIGLAGFNYNFDALNIEEKPNELNDAFKEVIMQTQHFSIFTIMAAIFKPFRALKTKQSMAVARAKKTLNSISSQLLQDSQAAVSSGSEKEVIRGRDLLSLLVKANTSLDIPEQMKMSDEDVKAQIPTFLIAGHETTSTATAWALFALTKRQDVQRKLRAELLTMDTETPNMDELSSLPYLDLVVKEVLRLHSPVPTSSRVAQHDDVIPFEYPFTDINGKTYTSFPVKKGDTIMIPILSVNQSKAIWGEDAHEFRPERWENVPTDAHKTPSVWSSQLTFLAGPRACIGWRFSIIEMKALLYTLVRAFEFDHAVPAENIWSKQTVVQRPILSTDIDAGHQLPLIVKPYHA